MCGIIGYIGKKNAVPVLIQGLERLEYRGYDSVGICIKINRHLEVLKRKGKVSQFKKIPELKDLSGSIGIGHCLTPDTLIQITDGRIIPISKINERDKIFSLDIETQKLEPAQVKIFKHKSPQYLYYLRTSFSDLKCTGEHKMFVFSEGKIIEKKAIDISKNDKLIILERVKIKGKKIKFKQIFVKRYYKASEEINLLIQTRLKKENLVMSGVSAQTGIASAYIDHIIRNDRNFREDQLEKFLPFLQIKFPSKEFIPQNTIHGKFITLPKESSSELMQIIGYFLGDGTAQPKTIRFKDMDKGVLRVYQNLIKKVFNIDGRIVPQKETRAYLLEERNF